MPTDTDTDRPLIAVAVLASFVAFLDGSVVNLALPAIGREFGGGLALYTTGKKLIGGLGVGGDTSCSDHYIAWRVRNLLGLDQSSCTSRSCLPPCVWLHG